MLLTSWPAIFLQDLACAALNGVGQESAYTSTQTIGIHRPERCAVLGMTMNTSDTSILPHVVLFENVTGRAAYSRGDRNLYVNVSNRDMKNIREPRWTVL